MPRPLHIGLIGGIGVAATLVYYQRLTAAVNGRFDLTIVHADVQDLVRTNPADLRAEQARLWLPLVERLQAAGCDCAAITSLGGHFCFDELAAISPLPLVSGVAPLDAYFADHGLGTVGLLGTQSVMQSGLFGQLRKTRAIAPDDTDHVGQSYQDMAVAGFCTNEQRKLFLARAAELIGKGADAVVLAGTDLNLAFNGQQLPFPVIDALDVHVALLADLATGRTDLPA